METALTDILLAVLTVVVTTLTASFIKWVKGARELREQREEEDKEIRTSVKLIRPLAEGMKSLLRAELISMHNRYTERGSMSLSSKEYVQRTYESYKSLGGNDIGQTLYEDMMELPIKGK